MMRHTAFGKGVVAWHSPKTYGSVAVKSSWGVTRDTKNSVLSPFIETPYPYVSFETASRAADNENTYSPRTRFKTAGVTRDVSSLVKPVTQYFDPRKGGEQDGFWIVAYGIVYINSWYRINT